MINAIDMLGLTGLRLASPQVLGGVRLVPILRDDVPGDLRLMRRRYQEDINIALLSDKTEYVSYAPHALIANWSGDGSLAPAFGTQLKKNNTEASAKDGKTYDFGIATARVMRKLRARESKDQLRLLPMDLAMEGFLALHFGGPDVAWEEYSRQAISRGLGTRTELSIPGMHIVGLEDALRVFEIHHDQVGVLVFVADSLASAFVLPNPDDYRALHRTLLTDSYGELIYYYGLIAQENTVHPRPIEPDHVESLADLRAELGRLSADWSIMHQTMAKKLIGCAIQSEVCYRMGPFSLQRFMTDLDPKSENHIGECIVRQDGTVEYLKTYRLSAAQCRRAFLLKQLAESDWELDACAEKLKCDKNQLVFRMKNAGFGYLLHQHVIDAAQASARRKRY